jgi:hypothetical protein
MATYIRHATRALKVVVDLGTAHTREILATDLTAVYVLDKGTGSFTLTFIFEDGTEFDLDQDEVTNGESFEWDVKELRITNTAQSGVTLKLLVDQQVGK